MSNAKKHNILGAFLQKLAGFSLIEFEILRVFVFQYGDQKLLLLVISFGLYLMFTNQAILYERRKSHRTKRNCYEGRYAA